MSKLSKIIARNESGGRTIRNQGDQQGGRSEGGGRILGKQGSCAHI